MKEIATYLKSIATNFKELCNVYKKPSVLYRAKVLWADSKGQWCAYIGPPEIESICGFGSSPAEAMQNLDDAFTKKVEHIK